MNLALSNLAWDFKDNDIILNKLKEKNILQIEGVLSKIDDWDNLNEDKIIEFKKTLNKFGIKVKTIQSIFYNVKCNGIGDTDAIINHIKKLIIYCELLNVDIMVFGSPNLRVGDIDEAVINSFQLIDELLSKTNIEISIEPNSKIYGGNYFYSLNEIVNFINTNNFKRIKTMVDTHNLVLEGYCPSEEFIKYKSYINHIHISEPGLKPISDIETHLKFYNTIKNNHYKNTITYEVNGLMDFDLNIDNFIKIYNPTK
jgi:sugar phosphate isomerase/epimerase